MSSIEILSIIFFSFANLCCLLVGIGCVIIGVKSKWYNKTLEIIINKRVNVGSFIKCCADIDYKKYCKDWFGWKKDILYNLSAEMLTEKEFNLLKRVLL